MTDELERLIRADGSQDMSRLDGIEHAVWARVGAREARRRLTRTQGVALGLSLMIGLTSGGLLMLSPRPAPSEMKVFSVSTGLSPLSVGVER